MSDPGKSDRGKPDHGKSDLGPILFVDDEASMRQAVTQWLELSGFELLVHDNAASALGVLTSDFRGILVTDLKMEGMDGLTLLRRAQRSEEHTSELQSRFDLVCRLL